MQHVESVVNARSFVFDVSSLPGLIKRANFLNTDVLLVRYPKASCCRSVFFQSIKN